MKVFDLDKEVPRPKDRAEQLASWYLRFNGFFPLTNFILHDAGAVKQVGGQLTDADVIALRPPHVEETIGGSDPIFVQPHLDLKVQQGLWDFIIAEVTCEPSRGECKFNWVDEDDKINVSYLTYCLRRFGFWDSTSVPAVARELSGKRSYSSVTPMPAQLMFQLRLLSFGLTPSEKLWGIHQVTFESVLRYLQGPLFGCYGAGIVSDHKQWHPMISEIYNRLRGHKTKHSSPDEVLAWLFPGLSRVSN